MVINATETKSKNEKEAIAKTVARKTLESPSTVQAFRAPKTPKKLMSAGFRKTLENTN